MTKTHWLLIAAACGLVITPVTIWAQNRTSPAPKAKAPATRQITFQEESDVPENAPPPLRGDAPPGRNQPAPRGDVRDPTTVRPDLQPILDPPEGRGRAIIPSIQLRARIVSGGASVGIIEIDKQYFTIEEGSRIDVGNVTLEVKKISAQETTIHVEELDRTLKIR